MKTLFSFFALSLLLFCFSCGEKCHDDSIQEVYKQAVIYPERFDSWLAQHPEAVDGDFSKCLDQVIDRSRKVVEEEKAICDEAHVEGSDFWQDCYDEVDLYYGNYYTMLLAVRETVRGNTRLADTPVGASLIIRKQFLGAQEYENFTRQVAPAAAEYNRCEICEKKLF